MIRSIVYSRTFSRTSIAMGPSILQKTDSMTFFTDYGGPNLIFIGNSMRFGLSFWTQDSSGKPMFNHFLKI